MKRELNLLENISTNDLLEFAAKIYNEPLTSIYEKAKKLQICQQEIMKLCPGTNSAHEDTRTIQTIN